jgi:hypothetical protein
MDKIIKFKNIQIINTIHLVKKFWHTPLILQISSALGAWWWWSHGGDGPGLG